MWVVALILAWLSAILAYFSSPVRRVASYIISRFIWYVSCRLSLRIRRFGRSKGSKYQATYHVIDDDEPVVIITRSVAYIQTKRDAVPAPDDTQLTVSYVL